MAKYAVQFTAGDGFPYVVCTTDDLATALESANCFDEPAGWGSDDDYSDDVCMSVIDTEINACVYWTNTDGDRGSDVGQSYPGYILIDACFYG